MRTIGSATVTGPRGSTAAPSRRRSRRFDDQRLAALRGPRAPGTWPSVSAPSVTARRSTRAVASPPRRSSPSPSRTTASAGNRRRGGVGTGAVLEEAHLDAHVRAGCADRAASNAMRTRTVAFCRSAVGTMLITWPGIFQSGYASSTASTRCSSCTRLMYASLTSTSISRESMSTIVAMPVRVKPPPADIGDTVSPGCASLEITTPANGARTSQVVEDLLGRPRAGPAATPTSAPAADEPRRAAPRLRPRTQSSTLCDTS